MYAVFFKKIKKSLLEENLKYLIKVKYFKSTSHFGFQLVSDLSVSTVTVQIPQYQRPAEFNKRILSFGLYIDSSRAVYRVSPNCSFPQISK